MYNGSTRETGRYEVFVAAFPSFTEKRQVSSGGGGASTWRKDGKEVLYVMPDASVMSVEIKTGSRIEVGTPKRLFQILTASTPDSSIAATRDGQRFLVIEANQANQRSPITVMVNWAAELRQ